MAHRGLVVWWAARIRRGGPGESAPRGEARCHQGAVRKRGGCAMKVVGLIVEVSAGVRDAGHAWRVRGWEGTAMLVRVSLAVEKSAEVVLPAGSIALGRTEREAEVQDARARGMDVERSQPREGSAREVRRVKPEDHCSERSPSRRRAIPHLTPLRRACGSSSWPRESRRGAQTRRAERRCPGIDGMSTKELRPWLKGHWQQVCSQLEAGTYRPQPVGG